jgi:hypothetical protein
VRGAPIERQTQRAGTIKNMNAPMQPQQLQTISLRLLSA